MAFLPNGEVLHPEWIPPRLLGAAEALGAAERALANVRLDRGDPLVVVAPPGGGSSCVARSLARALLDRQTGASRGRLLAVRVRERHGTTGVAGELLRGFDEGFHERGFSVSEIMAGLLRRMVREGRPVVILLDDIGPGVPELGPILAALRCPERFLPEGLDRPPEYRVLLAGTSGAGGPRALLERLGWRPGVLLRLPTYSEAAMREILLDRAERALGGPVPAAWIDEILRQGRTEGRGVARALELLALRLGHPDRPPRPSIAPALPGPGPAGERLARALEEACADGPAPLARVRALEDRFARESGDSPLPTTTFWRRIVRLEQGGSIVREVRSGGPGGSRSVIRLLRPLRPGSGATARPGTPPASAVRSLGGPAVVLGTWSWAPRPARPAPDGFGPVGAGSTPARPRPGT
jgi:hypothetical protein